MIGHLGFVDELLDHISCPSVGWSVPKSDSSSPLYALETTPWVTGVAGALPQCVPCTLSFTLTFGEMSHF